MAAAASGPADEVTVGRAVGGAGPRAMGERLIVVAATGAFALSVALHLGVLAGADLLPAPPWSWGLHAGVVVGFWLGAGRIAAARIWGVAGLLRMRRMIPIPVRVALAAAALNTLVATGLVLSGGVVFGRALLAYWTLMYLVITVIFAFVVPGIRAADALAALSGGRS